MLCSGALDPNPSGMFLPWRGGAAVHEACTKKSSEARAELLCKQFTVTYSLPHLSRRPGAGSLHPGAPPGNAAPELHGRAGAGAGAAPGLGQAGHRQRVQLQQALVRHQGAQPRGPGARVGLLGQQAGGRLPGLLQQLPVCRDAGRLRGPGGGGCRESFGSVLPRVCLAPRLQSPPGGHEAQAAGLGEMPSACKGSAQQQHNSNRARCSVGWQVRTSGPAGGQAAVNGRRQAGRRAP